MEPWYDLPVLIGVSLIVVIMGIALVVLWKIVTNKIDISQLIAEPDNKASLSRFQFLIFTFVIAGVYLLLCVESGTFVDIPESVLGLLGISGASYVISKGIGGQSSKGGPASEPPPAPPVETPPPPAPRRRPEGRA